MEYNPTLDLLNHLDLKSSKNNDLSYQANNLYNNLRNEWFDNDDFNVAWQHYLIDREISKMFMSFETYSEERKLIAKYIYAYFYEISEMISGRKRLSSYYLSKFKNSNEDMNNYVQERLFFLHNSQTIEPIDDLDVLTKKIMQLANQMGIDITDECDTLFDCMIFDLNRKSDIKNNEIILSSQEDIEKYNFSNYVEAYNKIVRMVTSTSIEGNEISTLNYANKSYIILRNFLRDLSNGIVNISEEDANKYDISEAQLIALSKLSPEDIRKFESKGFNYKSVKKKIDFNILNTLNDRLDIALNDLYIYENKLILDESEIKFDEFISIMFEPATSKYLEMLNKRREKKDFFKTRYRK